MWNRDDSELQERNSQAARDALRRRQKQKKSKTVKRHVLYKQKQRLLNQLAEEEPQAPIVASELGRPGSEHEDDDEKETKMATLEEKKTDETNAGAGAGTVEADAGDVSDEIEVDTKQAEEENDDEDESDANEDGSEIEIEVPNSELAKTDKKEGGESGSKNPKGRSYERFAKQRKEYEEWRREQDELEREQKERIKKREEMLTESRKTRQQKVCGYVLQKLLLTFVCQ